MIQHMIRVTHPRRRADLLHYAQIDTLPVRYPYPIPFMLEGVGVRLIWLVQWEVLDGDKQLKIASMVAEKHRGTVKDVIEQIYRNDGLPIMADGAELTRYGQFIFNN